MNGSESFLYVAIMPTACGLEHLEEGLLDFSYFYCSWIIYYSLRVCYELTTNAKHRRSSLRGPTLEFHNMGRLDPMDSPRMASKWGPSFCLLTGVYISIHQRFNAADTEIGLFPTYLACFHWMTSRRNLDQV